MRFNCKYERITPQGTLTTGFSFDSKSKKEALKEIQAWAKIKESIDDLGLTKINILSVDKINKKS